MGLLSEVRRRNVDRMAVLYVVAAWLIMQVAEVLISLLVLPPAIGPVTFIVLAIGFPIALAFSWFYELTPEGLALEKDVDRAKSVTHITGRRMDFIVMAILAAAVVVFAYDKWWLRPAAGEFQPPRNSIAVLAFADMSPGLDHEYLSDGVSEELLNLLAKIPELRVISRTSAFYYKDKDIRLTDVARELNVAHILEGSIRKIGDQIRITAQLIEARSDTHLWSETYDRELGDIFEVQDEIAAEVVQQLKISLLGEPPELKETDPQAYALILEARHLNRKGTPEDWNRAVELIEQALALDPAYAAAWDSLASIYISQANNSIRPVEEGYAQARKAAQQALALDPTHARAHARLGWIAAHHLGDLAQAAQHYEHALDLDPTNTRILFSAASLANSLGRLELTIALEEYGLARDPLDAVAHNNQGDSYLSAGRLDDAIASFLTALTLSPDYVGAQYRVGVALLLKGESGKALAAMHEEKFEAWRLLGLAMAHHSNGQAAESDAAIAELIRKYERDAAYNIAYVFAFRGQTDKAFEWLDKAVLYNDPGLAEIANEPLFSNIKTDTRWDEFLEGIGKAPWQLDAVKFDVSLPAWE